MPIQHPTYALPLQGANTIATKQSHDAELNRVVTILVENDRDLNATFERAIVTGPIVGEWDAGTGAFPTLRPNGEQIRVGDTWRVIGNGTVDGQAFYSGDYLQAITAGGGVTFNGNWARAALGQIEADRIAAETAAAEAQAYAEMAEFTRVTVIASGDGTANPITLPISVDSALRVQVFVNMTRWVPGDDYTVSGYDLAPVSPLVWPSGDRNLLILIDRPVDLANITSEDVTHDGQPISQILDRIDAQNTFYLQDYLHPTDLAFAEVGNTGSQNEARVTAAVQAFHDAALGWMMTANNRHVTLVYPNIVLAINDEMFSETWAQLLWTTGGSRGNCRAVFQFNGVRFQTKNWIARAAVRTSGLYLERGITYPVPKAVFRYEARTPGNPRIETQGRIYIFGSDNPDTDPIGLKFKSVNISQFDCFFFQALRNTAFYHENIFNSTFYNWQISSCGYQPTEYGGNGFMSETVRFQNVGRVITATEPVFDASHVGRRFMLVGAAAANGQGFQTHSGVIESVDSPTQITLTAATAPYRNVADPVVASFEAIKATTTAGSNVVTLSAPITDNLAGRYVTLFGCGQNDIAYNGQYYGAMTVVVTAHSGDQITLAHPARLSRTNIPISFGTSMVITRGAENSVLVGSMAGRTDDCTYYDARIVNGTSPYDGASMMALIQHCSSTAFVGGTKFHGVSAREKNNFGANFANLGFDYATGIVLPESILTHGGYSASAAKIIMTGGFTGVTMECDEVAYPDTTETATVLCDPTPDQIGVTLRLGNTRTDGRVGNAVKVRYGSYGNASMIKAANSAARLLRGIDVIDGGVGEDTIVGTGTTPAIPDWPTDLHDVLVTGDTLATGWGSTRSRAVSWLGTGGWVPRDGTVYTIGGLQYRGQTGATAIADLPGLVPAAPYHIDHIGVAADGITDDAPKIEAMLSWVWSNGGGKVHFAAKTYGLGTADIIIPANVSLIGQPGGTEFLILSSMADGSSSVFRTGASGSVAGQRPNTGIVIDGITFNGNRASLSWSTSRSLVSLRKAEGAIVRNCEFKDFAGVAISDLGCLMTVIEKNRFTNCARSDVEAAVVVVSKFDPDGTQSVAARVRSNAFVGNMFSTCYLSGDIGAEFSENYCYNNGESAVYVGGSGVRDAIVARNTIDTTTQYFTNSAGVELASGSKNIIVKDNIIRNTARAGICVQASETVTIVGNLLENCATSISRTGTSEHLSTAIEVSTIDGVKSSRLIISGNIFAATGGGGQKYCISGNQRNATATFSDVSILGNTFVGGYHSSGYPLRWFNNARPVTNFRYANNMEGIGDTPVPNRGYWTRGAILNRAPSAGGFMFSVCTTGGWGASGAWVSGATYIAENCVSVGTVVYRCAAPGAGASTVEPSVAFGYETTADGYTWQRMGTTVAVFKGAGGIAS